MVGEELDDDCVAAAGDGDPDALATLYRSLQPGLLRYLRAQGAAEPDDIASEVWIQMAPALSGAQGVEGVRRLLYTVARRRVIDEARRSARRRTDPVGPEEMTGRAGQAEVEADVLDGLAGDAAAARIRALLPPDQAEVVLLRVVAGLDVEAVAAVTGRRPAAVSVLQHRGLRRLARRLGRPEHL